MTEAAVKDAPMEAESLIGGKLQPTSGLDPAAVAESIRRGHATAQALAAWKRAEILLKVSEQLAAEKEEMARLISSEVDKPIKEARREVDRAVFTFRWASEETKRYGGELMPLDFDANTEGRMALVKRVSRGPCLLIAPFNFPLNLVAHKVAPAVAVGASFLLKPPPQAPKTSLALGRMLLKAGLPADAFAVYPCSNEAAEALVKDERFSVLSFTGSGPVGWKLKALSGKKHVVLELGGNGTVLVGPDADVPWAAARSAWGGFYYSGQVCISVQRIFAHASVYEDFKKLFLANVSELVVGEASDEKTDVAPLINEAAAARLEAWIEEAKAAGATVLAGGPRKGKTLPPTVLEDVPASCKVSCEEAFGPVVTLERFESWNQAFARIEESRYGLQCGLFTKDLRQVMDAWGRLPVGGIIVNDIPAFRSDAMPYGGSKDSGIGREGVRWAMDEYTEPRTLVLKP